MRTFFMVPGDEQLDRRRQLMAARGTGQESH